MDSEFIEAESLQVVKKEKSLLQIADEAEKMIDAVKKIKKIALKMTNAEDWTDQQGKPYLEGSGSEKIAMPFAISWALLNDPLPEFEEDGHFTYTYRGKFSMGNRTIEVDGSRSSRDGFFKKYNYDKNEKGETLKTEKPISQIIKRDVKMSSYTNLLGNGVTRILGIRNLTWEDLKEFAGITQDQVKAIQYAKDGKKPPLKEPEKKTNGTPPGDGQKVQGQKITSQIEDLEIKKGIKDGKPWTMYSVGIIQDGKKVYGRSFSDTIGKLAEAEKGTGMPMEITFEMGKYGMEIKEMLRAERQPGDEG